MAVADTLAAGGTVFVVGRSWRCHCRRAHKWRGCAGCRRHRFVVGRSWRCHCRRAHKWRGMRWLQGGTVSLSLNKSRFGLPGAGVVTVVHTNGGDALAAGGTVSLLAEAGVVTAVVHTNGGDAPAPGLAFTTIISSTIRSTDEGVEGAEELCSFAEHLLIQGWQCQNPQHAAAPACQVV